MTIRPSAEPTFVLTLKLDASSFVRVNALRELHFPKQRNWLPAHLTLLHTVSCSQMTHLIAQRDQYERMAPIAMVYDEIKLAGHAVVVHVDAPALFHLRSGVMNSLPGAFTRQDQQPLHAHVTIQNKVDLPTARALFAELSAEFVPWTGHGEGLLLWRYLGGPWKLEAELLFGAS